MSLSTKRAPELVPELINELSRNFWNSAVLRAGIKLGVFPLLENQSLTASVIADHLNANPRFVEAFLEACTILGLLDKTGDTYRNADMATAFLIPDGLLSLRPAVRSAGR